MSNPTLLLLPGDGIGPEIAVEVRKVIDWFETHRGISFDILEDHVGAAAIDVYGTYLSDETLARALEVDVVLLGAVGAPRYDHLPFAQKPEQALLKLRKEMDLFTNLRPVQCLVTLSECSPLKPDITAGLDIMIVRELTSGIYFGEPRGIIVEGGERVGINTHRYSESEIKRIARSAFDVARVRSRRVCSMDKSNVMEAGLLWREVVTSIRDTEYPDIELSHMLADAGLMQTIRDPKQFDVIVTDNLFGDILSDAASILTGSLGMLPSASLGPQISSGRKRALYEPTHGSAPDIAGRGIANPIAAVLCFAMALRLSFNRLEEAVRLEKAVEMAIVRGFRTADLINDSSEQNSSTTQMGDAIIAALNDLNSMNKPN